jgi:hypothetical protein
MVLRRDSMARRADARPPCVNFVTNRGYDEGARPALEDAIALDAQTLIADLSTVNFTMADR